MLRQDSRVTVFILNHGGIALDADQLYPNSINPEYVSDAMVILVDVGTGLAASAPRCRRALEVQLDIVDRPLRCGASFITLISDRF